MTRPHPQRIFAPSRPGSLLKGAGTAAHAQRKDQETTVAREMGES